MEHSAQNTTERAIAGDSEALGVLWTEHRSWLAAVALSVLGDARQLEDTLQEIAVAVSIGISELRSADALRPWLRSVARNVATANVRRSVRDRRVLDTHAAHLNGSSHIERDSRCAGRLDDLARLVSALPVEYREPLLLRAGRSMPIGLIAETLELTPAAVETRLRRARRLLRDTYRPSRAHGVS